MTQVSEDLSVADLFAEREERRRRDQEAAERFQRRKEEELAAFKQRLENVHLVDEMIPAQLARIKKRVRARRERVDGGLVPLRLLH